MLSVAVHKDIAEYQPKIIGKLTLRTLLCIVCAVGISLIVGLYLYFVLGFDPTDFEVLILAISMPFWAMGFWRPRGMKAETFAEYWIEYNFTKKNISHIPSFKLIELVMEVGNDPFITFYPDFAEYLQAERESLAGVSISKGNLMNDRNMADCRNNKLDSLIHAAEVKGIGNAFDSALGTGAVFAAKVSEAGTDAPESYGLLSNVRGMRLSDFLEQSTDCSSGVDTLLLTTDQGKAVSVVEECHGAIRADGTEKVTEIEFRQLKPFEAYKTAQLLQSDGLDSAELDSLAAKIFMDMDGLQMCTDLAEQMAWECSTERTELAEVLWNGDPEQGIAALEDVAVDDDDCIKQEWMGYKPGTPRFAVWKDFETNFSKDGVSLYELSGFDDYKVEYKDPGPTLSESEFNKLFSSDVLDENVQKDVSDVNRDDPGSEDER